MDNLLPNYEITQLPSRFIPYPEGIKVFTQPYSFGAALNIEIVGRNSINTMSEILEGIKVEGMPKNLLTPQDILFVGVYRNLMSSMHDKISITSHCPKCLKENVTVETLKSIKFKDIEDFNKDVYPIEVDFDNYTMWFGFISYKDFDFCMRKYSGNKLFQIALQVVKYKKKDTDEIIEKPNYTFKPNKPESTVAIERYVEDLRHILYRLVDEDKDTLDEVIDILEDYGLKPIEITCTDEFCKHKYNIDINDENVVVLPFREVQKSARNRIKLSKIENDDTEGLETFESEGGRTTDSGDKKGRSQEIKPTKPKTIKKPTTENQIQYLDKETN